MSRMLSGAAPIAFVGVTDLDRALRFYRDVLGLTLRHDETPFALVFDCAGTMLRVSKVEVVPEARFTVLGWTVPDIPAAVRGLAAKGITFMRVPELPQDELGIWTVPDGTQVAWFRDPDGNILSLTQFPSMG